MPPTSRSESSRNRRSRRTVRDASRTHSEWRAARPAPQPTPLPPATGARKDALQKKKQLFRERIRRRNEQRLAAGEEEIERDSDDSGDGGDQQEDREEVVAAVEAEMLGVLGGANISSQREAWPEVIDGTRLGQGSSHAQPRSPTALTPFLPLQVIDAATKMEQLMQKSSGLRRSTGAGILLRVLRQSLKTVGKDENRARSALAVLMIVEWCVPQLWRNSWQLCAVL